jgi:hypothetical protein
VAGTDDQVIAVEVEQLDRQWEDGQEVPVPSLDARQVVQKRRPDRVLVDARGELRLYSNVVSASG